MSETSGFDGYSYFLYHLASKFAADKSVLDIGCGIGQGASILSGYTQKKVLGVDYSVRAIKQARKNVKANLSFHLANILDLDHSLGKFDLITMFNTIEHFDKSEQERIMKVVYGLLDPNGTLIICTNNKRFSTGMNPFHKREMSVGEFKGLVELLFKAKFSGITQQFHKDFKEDGLKNKSVGFIFKPKFMQSVIQPMIPPSIRNYISANWLKLPLSQEKDFSLTGDLEESRSLLAICNK